MLVLTRRVGEEIVIGGDIRVTIVAIQGSKVRLGVYAPQNVTVDRQEVHERRHEFIRLEAVVEIDCAILNPSQAVV
jgi:carbon storage regulator